MKNKTRRWLLPAVSVAVKQTLQIFVCYRRGSVVQIFHIFTFSHFSCRARDSSGVPLCIQGVASHQRCFICSGPAANLMAPSSAKCPFNLAEETQVVSLIIPARRAPAFSLAVTAGERRTEGGERENERERLEPGRRIKSNDSVFTLCIQKCQTLSLSGAVDK